MFIGSSAGCIAVAAPAGRKSEDGRARSTQQKRKGKRRPLQKSTHSSSSNKWRASSFASVDYNFMIVIFINAAALRWVREER